MRHTKGRSYPDLVRLGSGRFDAAPDTVMWPGSHEGVRVVLQLCSAEGVAVVPFGGGTSVVGGVDAVRGPSDSAVTLDLGRMDALRSLDLRSLTVSVGDRAAGAGGRAAPRARAHARPPTAELRAGLRGRLRGHALGRSGLDRLRAIDELLVGARLAAPTGELDLPPRPPSAAGPQRRQLVAGSEGVLGVITRVDLRVRPVAQRRAAGPRRDGRDARDREAVVQARAAARGRPRLAALLTRRSRHAAARDVPHLPPLPDGRLAVLHVHRPPAGGHRARPVACGEDGGERRERGQRRHDHLPTRSASTTRRGCAPRWGRAASRSCARPSAPSTQPGS